MSGLAAPGRAVAGGLSGALAAAAGRLAAAGVGSPRVDAELLAAHVLGCPRAGLATAAPMDVPQAARFADLVERRAGRVPLQYLTGVAHFRHLSLQVGPGVFVPRPETELLVDLVLPQLAAGDEVADLCAGSGAVGLAIAGERPGVTVHAVEADPVAVGWLRRNAAGSAVQVHQAPVATWRPGRPLDAVVSNPPYLIPGTLLDPEVAEHEPGVALWGGPGGLHTIREVAGAAWAVLRRGGRLAVEHDQRHQTGVVDILRATGFTGVVGHRDLAGRDRFVTGGKP